MWTSFLPRAARRGRRARGGSLRPGKENPDMGRFVQSFPPRSCRIEPVTGSVGGGPPFRSVCVRSAFGLRAGPVACSGSSQRDLHRSARSPTSTHGEHPHERHRSLTAHPRLARRRVRGREGRRGSGAHDGVLPRPRRQSHPPGRGDHALTTVSWRPTRSTAHPRSHPADVGRLVSCPRAPHVDVRLPRRMRVRHRVRHACRVPPLPFLEDLAEKGAR